MGKRLWLSSLAIGALIAVGGMVTRPFDSTAQQSATPPATTSTAIHGQPIFEPAIDLAQAQETALTGQSGAAIVSVDLNGEEGVLVYDIELDNGFDVEVDATTGAVLKSEPESNDDAENNDDDANEHEGQDDDNGEGEDGD
jgi:hypothetical protein